jgi:hypothetical protein
MRPSHPSTSRFLPVLAGLLLAASLCVAQARSAPAAYAGLHVHDVQRTTRAGIAIETGRLGGVAYRIDVPKDWNHRLVVFYHGYSLDPVRYDLGAPQAWLAPMLARGYAVIQSAYAQTGWALQSAMADTAQLRAYFIARHGAPRQTLVAGDSMGGALTALTIESDPGNYQGALALCGALAPSWELGQRQFRMLAAFAYYFPGILPTLGPVPADYAPTPEIEQRIAAAFAAHPGRFADLRAIWHVGTPQDLPGVIAFATALVQRAQQQAGGNPFGNAGYVYLGTRDDAALNAGVTRYRADPAAVAYLLRYYTPSGRLLRPMLELHDLADPLVPADSVDAYAERVQRAGHAGMFVQQYVPAEGHCVFTGAEVGRAFDELTRWVDHGQRPQPGALPGG